MWARGTWGHNRFAKWQPVNADIQEAAEAQPISEDGSFKKEFHVG
jgi:hypothetical protein